MKHEIEGPHGCGVYGHNHYGLTRADVIFALEAEKAHIVNLNKCIHSFNEDGLISDTTHQMALNKLAELHKLLHSEMMEVLNRGDEINMESQ